MTAGRDAAPLDGIGVLVTRPAAQAEPLCRLIEQAGGTAHRFPVLEICPVTPSATVAAVLDRLAAFDLAIFISANAVEHGLAAVRSRGAWPERLATVAIGRATAAALTAQGLPPAICPSGPFDSETLLAHPELQQVAGRRVVIFRGVGGRELLAEALRSRGAEVAYVEAYRRVRPESDPAPLLTQWRAGAIDVAVVTSREGLDNLCALVGDEGRPWLLRTPLVVASDRVLKLVEQRGFEYPPCVAAEASDTGLFGAVVVWRRRADQPRDQ